MPHVTPKRLLLLLLLLAAVTATLCPTPAAAGLSGEVELGYLSYDRDRRDANGTQTDRLNGSSFLQRYSVLYSTKGDLVGGRLARYNVALGYEWGSFDTRIKRIDEQQDLSATSSHLLYRGEVIVDPAELPLRVRAYSQDLNRMTFLDTGFLRHSDNYIMEPDLITDLRDGTRITSGITAMVGVKNGLTNGYNALFRNLPMVMMDYRDEIVRDLRSAVPMDTRLQHLAFVSLNKRDNWVHYRSTRFTDNIDRTQSYTESQVQIGTVDQNLLRHWVNMTNWIKVSADGRFTKRIAQRPEDNFEEYDANLFGIATRAKWEARTFANYNRYLHQNGLNLTRSIPVYVSGVAGFFGEMTEWNVRALNREQILRSGEPDENSISNNAVNMRFTTFNRSLFTLSPSLGIEYIDNSLNGRTLALEAGVETQSTRRFSLVSDVFGSYKARYFQSSSTGNADNGQHYLTQDLTGSYGYSPTPISRLSLSQDFTLALGKNPQTAGSAASILPGGTLATALSPTGSTLDNYFRSRSYASIGWTPQSRVKFGLTLSEDMLIPDKESATFETALKGTASYSTPTFTADIDATTRYVSNDLINAYSVSLTGLASYKPNRNIESSLTARVDINHINGLDSRNIDVSQKFNYYIYKYNGVVRRLVDLCQELTYTDQTYSGVSGDQTVTSAKRLRIGVKYRPTSRMFLAGFARYSLLEPGSVTEQLYSASMGIDYRMLQANIEYSYGNQAGNYKQVEKKLAANLKKLF